MHGKLTDRYELGDWLNWSINAIQGKLKYCSPSNIILVAKSGCRFGTRSASPPSQFDDVERAREHRRSHAEQNQWFLGQRVLSLSYVSELDFESSRDV